MARVMLEDVTASRADATVLRHVSLAVSDGELVALVGPSGCGKTSVLRAIAGLDQVQSGRVMVGDRDVTRLPTRERDLAMVFESAQLQPHLDVGDNLGFPLVLRRVPKEEIEPRVEAEARAFSIRRLLRRRPSEVSAGERHAAATAHALVRLPSAILMDEPLAQLDVRARADAMRQIATVQAGYGVTLLVATNDQAVAAGLASRLVVLDEGQVRQSGPFQDLYDRPVDTFVAQFVGSPPMNLLPGIVWDDGDESAISVARTELRSYDRRLRPYAGDRVLVGIRPEHLRLAAPGDDEAFTATVRHRGFTGPTVHLHLEVAGQHEVVAVVAPPGPDRGTAVGLTAQRLHLFDTAGWAIAHDVR